MGSILHCGELLLLGFIWGHELLHHTLGVVTLIPRYTLFSILPLKACKHWFVIHFNIWSIFIATFILSSIPFISPFYVLVTTIKDHVDINRISTWTCCNSSFLCKILLWAHVLCLKRWKKLKLGEIKEWMQALKRTSSETQGQIVRARESLNGMKNMARRKVKNGEKSPWGQCLIRPVPNGRRRSGFWLVPENFCVFLPNQKPERRRPFGTGLVRHCPQGLYSPFFTFLRAIFSLPFRLSLAPTICAWVSEDVKRSTCEGLICAK